MIITPQTSVEERKRITKIWVANLQADAKRWKDKPFIYTPEKIGDPLWVEQFKKMKQNPMWRAFKKQQPHLARPLQQFIDAGLKYAMIDYYHHRIKNLNTGVFVDFWTGKKCKMWRSNGSFGSYKDSVELLLVEVKAIL